ncbi:MAG TPA: hypothetical protein PLU93_05440 [Treponemataceae bacterium]|jgi:hypothetical protein|nr:hypothetical protein [Treponemataceae bacterium]
MSESTQWECEKYTQVFEDEMRVLARRRENDPTLTPSDLEGTLKHLYIMDGNDQGGRGPVQDIDLAATIAAYERFIAEWKKELA